MKAKLMLDTLVVETFETGTHAPRRGTVVAHEETGIEECEQVGEDARTFFVNGCSITREPSVCTLYQCIKPFETWGGDMCTGNHCG